MTKEDVAKLLSKEVSMPEGEILKLLEKPKYSNLGDVAFPCFTLAAQYKKSPFLIAQEIASHFPIAPKGFSKIQAIGGYVNFFYDDAIVSSEILGRILEEGKKFGRGKSKRKMMVEFSQANTHKAFHVGHIRGTSLGECISRIFEFSGNKVLRANYQGDTGMHVAKWLWCYTKFHRDEKLKDDESWIASIYVEAVKKLAENEELQKEVDDINRKLELGKDKKLMALWKKTRKSSLDAFESIYKELGTKFDRYYFESETEKKGKEIAKQLLEKGIAVVDQGATIMDLRQYDLGVWILLRKDGTVLYSAKDLALAAQKFKKEDLDGSLVVIGAAQTLHTMQISKTLELMKEWYAKHYMFLHYSEVRLPTGKMSSRTGENILYTEFKKELVEHAKAEIMKRFPKISKAAAEKRALKIAIAAMKYSMLKQDPNKNIIFEKEQALSFEGDTGPYLQYSYARASSILKKGKSKPSAVKISKLQQQEVDLIKKMAEFPEVVESAYSNMNSSLIANYSFQLCQMFNEFYHACPVLTAQKDIMKTRLEIVRAFRTVSESALSILGIETLDEM